MELDQGSARAMLGRNNEQDCHWMRRGASGKHNGEGWRKTRNVSSELWGKGVGGLLNLEYQ